MLIFFLFLILAIIAECLLAGPLLAHINTVIAQGIVSHTSIYLSISTLFVILLLIAFCNALQTVCRTYYQKHVTLTMQTKMLKHLYHLKEYSSLDTGESFAHIDQNIEVYCSTKIEIIQKSSRAICLVAFSGIYISRISFSLMAFSYLLTGAIIILNYMTAAHVGSISKSLNEKSNELVKYRWEMIRNSEIAATLVDEKILKKYLKTNQSVYQLGIALSKKKLFSNITKRYGYLIVLIAVSIFGGLLTINHTFALEELWGIILLLPRLTSALFDLPIVLTDYSSNKGLKKSIDKILSLEQYVATDKMDLEEKIYNIFCSDISVSFGDIVVVHQFTFQFQSNFVYLIRGASGSGKSTLLRLLCRSLSPKSGIINVNSCFLNAVSRESLWRYVVYMPQNSVIFPTTLRKNITCNQQDDVERIYRCLKEVNLTDFRIGLNETVEVETLSAGEKQKIAFARALYHQNAALLLDEPTSAMDPVSEEICMASLYRKAHEEHIIVIVVSHSPSCDKFSDVICNMTDGKLEKV